MNFDLVLRQKNPTISELVLNMCLPLIRTKHFHSAMFSALTTNNIKVLINSEKH